jgi:hypothetical protein
MWHNHCMAGGPGLREILFKLRVPPVPRFWGPGKAGCPRSGPPTNRSWFVGWRSRLWDLEYHFAQTRRPADPLTRRPADSLTEAMYLMAGHVFDHLGYRRYEWKCNTESRASRRAAERLGFTFEGIFRQHMVVKGRNRDTAWYAMLDTEWPTRKRALEKWLAPGNFDEAGRRTEGLRAHAS